MGREDVIECAKKSCGENVAIFIDYDNIYHSMRDLAINIEDEKYNIIDLLWECYDRDKVRVIKAYADFDQVNVKLRDLQLNRVQIRQVYGNGQGEKHRKNASDIELSIDAIELALTNENIDTYVFVTADSDMIPIMSRMIFRGKKVHLFYTGTNISQYQDITKYSHFSNDILKTFSIDRDRVNPAHWKNDVLDYINKWYDSAKNKHKALGTTWLRGGLEKELSMSPDLASNCIGYLLDNKFIVQMKINDHDGCVDARRKDEFLSKQDTAKAAKSY
ncbi:MAG: NYN domain-containing protein [Sporolactobacillus sp.]|nr:NYN domain-containing protein [Sporolactobacillus sp.]